MKLANLKLSDADIKKRQEPKSVLSEAEVYPWGLSLNLDDDALEKLGLETLPKVGETMMLTARVKVTSVSSRDTEGGKPCKSCGLQLTDAALGEDADDEKPSPAKKLYDK